MNHSGSCLCGKIVFRIDGVFDNFFLCHCEHCRKDTGSAHAASLFSASAKLKWISGESFVKTFDYKSSGHIKSFCTECGSALPNIQMDGALLVVPAGSLDVEVNIKPDGHIFWANRANWDNELQAINKYDKLPNISE
ncbi:GFA family protein [Limisalsivibrio acetivorans]|uniref:GFA family protein n=1 Tax=Limisalsivibrio acetivorans TaxID=1304888 RepID=UPI0003B31AD6|nr:GFA family protein [Limisalsivibrio acetivorans]